MKKGKLILAIMSIALIAVSSAAVFQQKPREIKALHKPQRNDIEDLVTYNVMPSPGVSIDQMDPFLFLNHHGPQTYPANNSGLPFGPHPHKGFETVTFILEGGLLHKDNSGHKSVIGEGGIQWMTAGKGIVHSEISSEEFKKEGGPVEILQLWVNLPSKHKDAEPSYTGLQQKDVPKMELDDGKVTINIVSGSYEGTKAPIQSLTNVFMSFLDMKPSGKLDLSVDPSREIFFYVVSGQVVVNGRQVEKMTLVEFGDEGKDISLKADEESVILYGHATPTDEPVVARGPFVMNTEEEIRQAYKDYRSGKFGSAMAE